jgi:preprotein translocase subunit SecD
MKKIWLISFIFLITAVATYISGPFGLHFKIGKYEVNKKFDLKLGLDLAGGSHLVFETDMSGIPEERRETPGGARDVIEEELIFWVSEPSVQTSNLRAGTE